MFYSPYNRVRNLKVAGFYRIRMDHTTYLTYVVAAHVKFWNVRDVTRQQPLKCGTIIR